MTEARSGSAVLSLLPSGFFLFALAAAGAATLVPVEGQAMLVLTPPWSAPGRAVEVTVGAGGSLLGVGADGRSVLARSDDPGFAARLYREGAVLVTRAESAACPGRNP
jgi:hypothetical protein